MSIVGVTPITIAATTIITMTLTEYDQWSSIAQAMEKRAVERASTLAERERQCELREKAVAARTSAQDERPVLSDSADFRMWTDQGRDER